MSHHCKQHFQFENVAAHFQTPSEGYPVSSWQQASQKSCSLELQDHHSFHCVPSNTHESACSYFADPY